MLLGVVMRRGLVTDDRRVGGVRRTRLLWFLTVTGASFTQTDPRVTVPLWGGMMLSCFTLLPVGGGGGGRAGGRQGWLVEGGRRVGLLTGGIVAVFWLVGVERERRLLRVVAGMVVEVGIALHGGDVGPSVTIVMGVWAPPDLDLLRPPGRPFVLVGKAPITRPLLLLVVGHPHARVGEVAVAAPPTDVVMGVGAASLGADLSADGRRGSLTGRPRRRAGLLDWSQTGLSQAVRRRVAPETQTSFKTTHK